MFHSKMKHTKKEGSAWRGGGWGLAKTLLLVDTSPGKATLQLKCPQVVLGCLKSLDRQAAAGLLPGGRTFKTGKQVLFRNTRTWGSSKHEFTFEITGNCNFSGSKLEPMKNCHWIGTFLEMFIIPIRAGSEIDQNPNSSNHVAHLQESREGWLKW